VSFTSFPTVLKRVTMADEEQYLRRILEIFLECRPNVNFVEEVEFVRKFQGKVLKEIDKIDPSFLSRKEFKYVADKAEGTVRIPVSYFVPVAFAIFASCGQTYSLLTAKIKYEMCFEIVSISHICLMGSIP
jgi:hypothetical protein